MDELQRTLRPSHDEILHFFSGHEDSSFSFWTSSTFTTNSSEDHIFSQKHHPELPYRFSNLTSADFLEYPSPFDVLPLVAAAVAECKRSTVEESIARGKSRDGHLAVVMMPAAPVGSRERP